LHQFRHTLIEDVVVGQFAGKESPVQNRVDVDRYRIGLRPGRGERSLGDRTQFGLPRLNDLFHKRIRREAGRRTGAAQPGGEEQRDLLRHYPLCQQSSTRDDHSLIEPHDSMGTNPRRPVSQREVRPAIEELRHVILRIKSLRQVNRGKHLVTDQIAHTILNKLLGARIRNSAPPIEHAEIGDQGVTGIENAQFDQLVLLHLGGEDDSARLLPRGPARREVILNHPHGELFGRDRDVVVITGNTLNVRTRLIRRSRNDTIHHRVGEGDGVRHPLQHRRLRIHSLQELSDQAMHKRPAGLHIVAAQNR